jgi:hypothetical protein
MLLNPGAVLTTPGTFRPAGHAIVSSGALERRQLRSQALISLSEEPRLVKLLVANGLETRRTPVELVGPTGSPSTRMM